MNNCKCKTKCDKCSQPCGCKFEVESFACVRYDGPPLSALGIQTGDNLESVVNKINTAVETINNAIAVLQTP